MLRGSEAEVAEISHGISAGALARNYSASVVRDNATISVMSIPLQY